jgi:transposase
MDKRIKFSFKQKLQVVRSVIAGQDSIRSAARKIRADPKTVRRWLNCYKQHGQNGLKLRHGSYDGTFKVRVIRHMLKNQLSLIQTAAIFGIPQEDAISRWLKIYESMGTAGLLVGTQSQKKLLMGRKPKKNKNLSSKTAEEQLAALQAENEYLKAENAFLKKLDALIQQEKAAKAQSKRQKPSTN